MAPSRFNDPTRITAVAPSLEPWLARPASDECWEWDGYRTHHGYGVSGAYIDGVRHHGQAHRIIYILRVGALDPSLSLDHLCRNTGCVNPTHLEPVTLQENHRRRMTETLLDLLEAVAENPQPVAQQYRDRIRAAILADGRAHGGEVSPNRVRAALSNHHGLTVPPRMLSATYSVMRSEGLLERHGWIESDDTAGGNAGKFIGRWWLTEMPGRPS